MCALNLPRDPFRPPQVPIDAAAYCACLLKLTSVDPLGCEAFYSLRQVAEDDPMHDPNENHWSSLLHSTNRRWLAYDHVRRGLPSSSATPHSPHSPRLRAVHGRSPQPLLHAIPCAGQYPV